MGTLRPPYQQKYFFRPIGAFFLLKLKVTKIPIQNGPFLAPWAALVSAPAIAYLTVKIFLSARYPWTQKIWSLSNRISQKKNRCFSPNLLVLSSVPIRDFNHHIPVKNLLDSCLLTVSPLLAVWIGPLTWSVDVGCVPASPSRLALRLKPSAYCESQ